MRRVTTHAPLTAIRAALDVIPVRIRSLIGFDVFTEDPVFGGLHTFTDASFNRSYRDPDTAHVVYPYHQRFPAAASPTIVMRQPQSVEVCVHEIGHVLHAVLGFDDAGVAPVTAYAATDPYERFAESFTRWIIGAAYTPWMSDQREVDPAGAALFEELAR